ncbi:hypothetical protein [Microbulbifer sp. TRSA007]|uniref:hypothetical protein n=1 Tax=unclassified Microbulbifer TaxID=2619833 RepID=UPI0040399124
MNRRKLLSLVTTLSILIGLVFVATPFFASMNPNKAAKSSSKIRIDLSEIPEAGALEVDYQWYKALVVKNPEMTVFVVPYSDGTYWLPDPTWERPFLPCNKFLIRKDGFYCKDPSLHEGWHEQAQWDSQGSNKGTWMPDLQKLNFRIQGKYLVLSPEYN